MGYGGIRRGTYGWGTGRKKGKDGGYGMRLESGEGCQSISKTGTMGKWEVSSDWLGPALLGWLERGGGG